MDCLHHPRAHSVTDAPCASRLWRSTSSLSLSTSRSTSSLALNPSLAWSLRISHSPFKRLTSPLRLLASASLLSALVRAAVPLLVAFSSPTCAWRRRSRVRSCACRSSLRNSSALASVRRSTSEGTTASAGRGRCRSVRWSCASERYRRRSRRASVCDVEGAEGIVCSAVREQRIVRRAPRRDDVSLWPRWAERCGSARGRGGQPWEV